MFHLSTRGGGLEGGRRGREEEKTGFMKWVVCIMKAGGGVRTMEAQERWKGRRPE